MAIGWFTDLTEAESYYTNERLETAAWDAVLAGKKGPLLLQAYSRIFYSVEFDVPTWANATAEDLVILKKAQGEMAYYLAMHLDDEDRRKGIEAQAVVAAGVVKEQYDASKLYDTAVPPFVRDLLKNYLRDQYDGFGVVDISRDEDRSAKDKTDEF
jgi:hypothetical protein